LKSGIVPNNIADIENITFWNGHGVIVAKG